MELVHFTPLVQGIMALRRMTSSQGKKTKNNSNDLMSAMSNITLAVLVKRPCMVEYRDSSLRDFTHNSVLFGIVWNVSYCCVAVDSAPDSSQIKRAAMRLEMNNDDECTWFPFGPSSPWSPCNKAGNVHLPQQTNWSLWMIVSQSKVTPSYDRANYRVKLVKFIDCKHVMNV